MQEMAAGLMPGGEGADVVTHAGSRMKKCASIASAPDFPATIKIRSFKPNVEKLHHRTEKCEAVLG
jgi:hypothetical protein